MVVKNVTGDIVNTKELPAIPGQEYYSHVFYGLKPTADYIVIITPSLQGNDGPITTAEFSTSKYNMSLFHLVSYKLSNLISIYHTIPSTAKGK